VSADCYEYHKVGVDKAHNKENLIHVITYNFRSAGNRYLVEIEKYKLNTFVIKYFLQCHKKHKHRYNLLSNEFKCRPVVMTVINILMDVLVRNLECNFAFIGSETIDRKGTVLETKTNTKRFRVYWRLVENKIGAQTFTHFQSENGSSYISKQ
jgi:hypothetical protein